MWTTVSVYIALVLIAVVLYYLTRNTSKTGGKQNFWDWIKRGTLRTPPPAPVPRQWAAEAVGDEPDVVMVLEDIYREFQEETARLRQDMETKIHELNAEYRIQVQTLQDEIRDMRIAMQYREVAARADQEPAHDLQSEVGQAEQRHSSEESSTPSRESIYFQILDELQQGKRPEEIAHTLGVELDEIGRVIQFMSAP